MIAAGETGLDGIKAELERLRAENSRLREQRDGLAAICTAQAECLHEIMQSALIIDRAALAAVGPALREAPAGALRALVRLLEDIGEDGATGRAWTGKALGDEIGLARANHERLIAPLIAAGMIEPVGDPEHKARRYQLQSSLNAHSMRVRSLITRTQRAFGEALGGPSGLILPFPNAHSVRAGALSTRTQCAHPSLNAHSMRVEAPVVSSFIDSDLDQSGSIRTNPPTWDSAALEAFGAVTAGQGLSRDLREALLAREPVEAIALVLHARAETTRRPAALLRSMLRDESEPAPEYVKLATRKLVPPLPPEQPPFDPPAPVEVIGLDEKPGGTLTIREIWQATLGQLQMQLNRDTYAHLRDAKAVRFEDGILTVQPRPHAVRTFARLQTMLDQVVSGIAGAPIAVRAVNEAEPAPAQ
ncbi:MAG: hypothetical protein GX484_05245 [Chloroflexi bacterium]|nr:hypothetical protein [Chloroflexota bacterium]